MRNTKRITPLAPAFLLLTIAACGSDDGLSVPDPVPPPPSTAFQVTVTNTTNNQVFSPVAAVLHTDGYRPWRIGEPVSVGLEMIAEGGSTAAFVAEAEADGANLTTNSDSGPLMPGNSTTLTLSTTSTDAPQVSVATMLIRTNDGFTGLDAVEVSGLDVNESMRRTVRAYDAGTELNSETEATLVETGEGFNADRDDSDVVTIHAGVVTSDDGLATSFLDASHRWDNPVARITITRIN